MKLIVGAAPSHPQIGAVRAQFFPATFRLKLPVQDGITQPKSHFGKACQKRGIEVIRRTAPRRKDGWGGTTGWTRTGW
ncbi:hypothetical protein LQZ21_01505 [Treponema sp. TIM-1]